MGFAQDALIEVDGHMVSPRKVLLAMVPPPSNLFLLEDEEMLEINPEYDIDCQAAIELSGHKDDKFIKYRLSFNPLLYSNTEEKRHMYQMHGTFLSYTALPAVVGAALCSEGKAEPGMIGPECIDPLAFLSKTCDYGIDIPVRETRECTLKQLAQN